MVIYDLVCESSHSFEGWFKSSDEYTHQIEQDLVSCPMCHSTAVRKVPSASYISTANSRSTENKTAVLTSDNIEQIFSEMVEHIKSNTEDVGVEFVEEAQKIHYGESEKRNIRGIASVDDVEMLKEEGIEVLTIPGLDVDKTKLN